MRAARLAEPPDKSRVGRLEIDQRRLEVAACFQLAIDPREFLDEAALPDVDDDGHLRQAGLFVRRQLGHGRNQLRRQVIDAEVAEVFERADRLRLARPGQAGQDDEAPGLAGRTSLASRCPSHGGHPCIVPYASGSIRPMLPSGRRKSTVTESLVELRKTTKAPSPAPTSRAASSIDIGLTAVRRALMMRT